MESTRSTVIVHMYLIIQTGRRLSLSIQSSSFAAFCSLRRASLEQPELITEQKLSRRVCSLSKVASIKHTVLEFHLSQFSLVSLFDYHLLDTVKKAMLLTMPTSAQRQWGELSSHEDSIHSRDYSMSWERAPSSQEQDQLSQYPVQARNPRSLKIPRSKQDHAENTNSIESIGMNVTALLLKVASVADICKHHHANKESTQRDHRTHK